MSTLWIFNPDNDIALGNNLKHFTPPRNAMLLRQYGAMLPAWIADAGDIIFTEFTADATWLRHISQTYGKELEILTTENCTRVAHLQPWGWSRAIVDTFSRAGISSHLLPGDEQIERIRQLSHRHSSVVINRELQEQGFDVPIPAEFTDTVTLDKYIGGHGSVVIKSPWSSSGRGVIYSDRIDKATLLRHAEGIIKSQGSVLAEMRHDKIADFAMLFSIKDGNARYVGLSVFETLDGGNYTGNIVASEQHLSSIITHYVSSSYLERLRKAIEAILTKMVGSTYTGICGIDMMVYATADGEPHIAPCIELNLRYTMGYIAHCLARDIIAPGAIAKMHVTYLGNRSGVNVNESVSPQFDNAKRLVKGTLSLIPSNPHFAISLSIE